MPVPENLKIEIMARARTAQQNASPMQQPPWLARLVADVVQTTLDLVEPHLNHPPEREANPTGSAAKVG
ncbi:hypothetical protein [Pseudarthrobacter sp. Y6]|uniref:hypothetical protein n=1 Tax=Pseudarthrobacter sp. Y6 TaxID=3418422 RepID=UPI003CF7C3B7